MEKKKEIPTGINLAKSPYRGVLSEIAKEQNVTRSAIWDALFRAGNPRIRAIFMEKIESRKAITEKFNSTFAH